MTRRDQRSTKRATGSYSREAWSRKDAPRPVKRRAPVRHGKRTFNFSNSAIPTQLNAAGALSHQGRSHLLTRLRALALDLTASRAVALLLLCAMTTLLIWFFVDESFYVYGAQVQGNSLVSAGEVYQAGGLHCMSIFYIDRQQVARDIERSIPSVAEARVQCQLPARVSVYIREQDVRYLWRSAGLAFLVDDQGLVLKADDGTHSGLLAIEDLDNQQLHPGDQVHRAALDAASRLHSLLPDVQRLEYSAAKGISLSDARGWRVYFGDGQALAEKVATLQALLVKLAQENRSVRMIDLRFVESPCYQ